MTARVRRVLWGPNGVPTLLRAALVFGIYLLVVAWLLSGRDLSAGSISGDVVGAAAGAIVFAAIFTRWVRRRPAQ